MDTCAEGVAMTTQPAVVNHTKSVKLSGGRWIFRLPLPRRGVRFCSPFSVFHFTVLDVSYYSSRSRSQAPDHPFLLSRVRHSQPNIAPGPCLVCLVSPSSCNWAVVVCCCSSADHTSTAVDIPHVSNMNKSTKVQEF